MLSKLKYGRNRKPRPDDIKVGDRVKINHKCVKDYWDVTGTVLEIDNFCEIDDFDYHIKFDKPLVSGLDNEFFAYKELEKL